MIIQHIEYSDKSAIITVDLSDGSTLQDVAEYFDNADDVWIRNDDPKTATVNINSSRRYSQFEQDLLEYTHVDIWAEYYSVMIYPERWHLLEKHLHELGLGYCISYLNLHSLYERRSVHRKVMQTPLEPSSYSLTAQHELTNYIKRTSSDGRMPILEHLILSNVKTVSDNVPDFRYMYVDNGWWDGQLPEVQLGTHMIGWQHRPEYPSAGSVAYHIKRSSRSSIIEMKFLAEGDIDDLAYYAINVIGSSWPLYHDEIINYHHDDPEKMKNIVEYKELFT